MKLLGRRYKHEKKTIKNTFKNAMEGIVYTFNAEINLKLHLIVTTIVLLACYILEASVMEVIVCLLLIGLVISMELINTVIEVVVDMVQPKEDPLAKIAKDTASGAVLVVSFIAAIIGLIIFIPKALVFIGIM